MSAGDLNGDEYDDLLFIGRSAALENGKYVIFGAPR